MKKLPERQYSPLVPSLPDGPQDAQRSAESGTGNPDEVSLRDLLSIARRNFWLILLVTVLTVGVSLYFVLREVPTYRAEAVIRLQDVRHTMTGGLDGRAAEPIMMRARLVDPLASQLEVMRSRSVLGAVVDSQGLRAVSLTPGFGWNNMSQIRVETEAPTDTLQLRFLEDTVVVSYTGGESRGPYGAQLEFRGGTLAVDERPDLERAVLLIADRQRVIDRLAREIRARPREATDVFDVEYTAEHPLLAQQVVNAVVHEFRRQNVQAARQESVRRRVFIEEQLAATDSMLSEAQRTLSDFRRREQVFSSREWFAAQQTGLMSLDVRRAERAADQATYRAILDGIREAEVGQLSGRLEAMAASPEIAANPIVAGLYQQLAGLELARDSMISGQWARSASNPDVRRVELQIVSVTDRLEAAVRGHLTSLDARLDALDDLRVHTVEAMEVLPETEAEESRLVQRAETIRRMADQLREEHQRARIGEAVEEGQVQIVDPAAVPLDPVGSRRSIKLLVGLMVGLIVGTGAAFLRENLDTAIRRREDLESVLRVPGLGVVPRIGPTKIRKSWAALPTFSSRRLGSGRRSGSQAAAAGRWSAATDMYRMAVHKGLRSPETTGALKAFLSVALPWRSGNGRGGSARRRRAAAMSVADGRSAAAEAYRTVRTGLLFSEALHSLRTLLVTSPSPAEGKTTTAANLAITFAEQGKRVLLIDADLRRPRVHEVFELSRDPGLTQLVVGQCTLGEVVQETDYGLHLLPAGMLPPNPAELLGGERMREVLSEARSTYEFIIVDAAPLLLAADAAVLATRVDGTLLVVRAGKTDREEGIQALHQLAGVDARVVGAVLNDPDGTLSQFGGYYRYAYSYSGYYGDDV